VRQLAKAFGLINTPHLRVTQRKTHAAGGVFGDAQLLTRRLDAAFKNVAHAQLLADFGQIDAAALECEGRGCRDHKERRDARQRADQFAQGCDLDGQAAFLDIQIGPDMLQLLGLGNDATGLRIKIGKYVEGPCADHLIQSVDLQPAQVRQNLDSGMNGIGHRKSKRMNTEQTIEVDGEHANLFANITSSLT
jgi:hypothetical protein